MRNYILITLLSVFCFTYTAFAQKKTYEKEWLAIEQLEVDGKVSSALEKVNSQHTKATRSKNNSQILKTLLFRWKFQQIIDEKSQEKILAEVASAIQTQPFPNKQLLEMYMAGFFRTHLNSTFWNIQNRTATQDAALKDYRTWDLNTYLNQISLHYERALSPHLALAKVPTNNISELLITQPNSRKYKPSLYDIIAHEALDFNTNSRNRVNKPRDEFLITGEAYFTNSSTFVRSKLTTTDSTSLTFKALKTYQQLEEIHAQQKNEEALIYNLLKRLAFVKSNHIGNTTEVLYLESLKKTVEEFNQSPHVALIEVALAKAYRNLAHLKNEEGAYKNPDYNLKALQLCQNIVAKNTESRAAVEASNLIDQIKQQKITWLTQDQYAPNKPHLANVTFTNTKKIEVTAYKVSHGFSTNDFNYRYKDSLTKAFLKNKKIAFRKTYSLPPKIDYNAYSTEVIVPKMPLGDYLFSIQTDTLTSSLQYHSVVVSALSINKKEGLQENTYQVLDGYTGKAVDGATANIRTEVDRNRKEYTTSKKVTNSWGQFTINKRNRYQRTEITLSHNGDTLSISDSNYGRNSNYDYKQENNRYRSKTLVFLDRAIYRPQQILYFKAIAISEEHQLSQTLANKKIRIRVTNPNREEVFTTSLTTNAFGSVHGECKLPEAGLMGNYRIEAILEHPKSKKYHSNANQTFAVEEYKRPTFELIFTPLTKAYKPLDSIRLSGNAKAFLGSAISNAQVSYSVKRTTQYRFWWSRPSRNTNSKQIITGETTTDAAGEFQINFKAITDEADTTDKIYNYSVEVKVTDLNGETREATETIKVADKNIVANISTPATWNDKEPQKIDVNITDVNNNPITASGTIEVFKLQSSGRFLNQRLWSAPDLQQITKNEFVQQFPHTPFTNENDKKYWKKGDRYLEHDFSNASNITTAIPNFKKWPSGSYVILAKVTDPLTKASTENQQFVTLNKTDQAFPADEKVFVHRVDYDKNKPQKATIHLQTSVPELLIFAEAFDGDRSIWKEQISLKKGKKSIDIGLPKLNYPKVRLQYTYQLFHQFYTASDELDYTKTPVMLNIEKKHFVDKISPSTKETWSFVINSSDNTYTNAEALASMYDASLDQFKSSYWNTNFEFGKSYPAPTMARSMTGRNTASINFASKIQAKNLAPVILEKLNYYGFEFNRVNSWRYKNYLDSLKERLTRPKNSTGKLVIRGTVYSNSEGIPLPGANIVKEGSNEGAVSDFDGNFEIKVDIGDVLEVIYIGFKTERYIIDSAKNNLIFYMEEDSSRLDEVVVMGYGTKRSKKVSGAVSKTISPNLESAAMLDVDSALAGKVVGVSITENDTIEVEDTIKPEDLKNIKARTNLQETAFFLPNLRTNQKGEIEFQFETPEALTRWNFRMLAHTQKGVSGNINLQTLTQKELNIIPNAPRFVREGDSLRFTAKIANLTDQAMRGTALLEWTDPINNASLDTQLNHTLTTQNFSINANGNSLLSWKIAVPADMSAIQYKIVAKAGSFSDGEEKIIPVLSNRMLVTESIPLWVRAGATEDYSLNNFTPNSATQKPHAITLEYTSNPAWLAIKSLPYLMEYPHECSEQTFSRLYANTVASHIVNSQPKIKAVFDSWAAKETLQSPLETNEALKSILLAESPWLQEANSETAQQKRLGELFEMAKMTKANEKALHKLRQLQLANGGFPWFKGGRANPFITRHILAGFGHLEKLDITQQPTKTDNIIKNMIQFLDRELEKDLQEYLKRHKTADGFYKQVSLLHYTYARSFYAKRFPLKGEVNSILTKALAYHKNNWQQRSIYEKGLLALSLHRFEKSPVAQKIITSLTESAVQSKENGMYWKENQHSYWWYKNNVSTQSLLIEAFAEMEQPKKNVEEMKIFLLKNKRTNRWESTIETANASYALLLQGNDWLSVKDNTIIKVGNEKIATKKLAETEKEQGTGYLKTQWNAEEIIPEFKTISVTNKSKVTGYGGYYWQYFENLDNIKTDDQTPLSLQKQLYKKVTTNKGTELKLITPETPLNIGDKVTVRLLVKSHNDMEFVHLKDMRASGFEPTQVLSGYQYKDRLRFYQSTKDVATHFFIDYLPKGNYVLEYDVIANQNGNFSNGITTLQSMYAPEFSSHSAGQRVEILE